METEQCQSGEKKWGKERDDSGEKKEMTVGKRER
jgi:hypothetical protein